MIGRVLSGILVLLLAALAVPLWHHVRETVPPPPPAVRAALTAPPGAELGAGDDTLDAAISPDGRTIVFVATTDGVAKLWRRALDVDRAEAMPGTEGASLPAWKRDGSVVSFFADGRLRALSMRDGTISDLTPVAAPAGSAWLPDGSLLFAPGPRGALKRMRGGTVSDATTLRAGDVAHQFPDTVDAAGDFLYVALTDSGRRSVRLVTSRGETDLTRTSGHAAMVDDVLLQVSDGTLTAQRFDRDRGSLVGRASPLAFNVGVSPTGHSFFAAGARLIAWAEGAQRARELRWFAVDGTPGGTLSDPVDAWQVRLAPDDRLAAVTMVEPLLRTLDVFVLPADDRAVAARRLTLSLAADSDPVWSPAGDRIVFRSMQSGHPELFSRPPQFSERQDDTVLRSDLDESASDWNDGTLLFTAPDKSTGLDVWALDVASGSRHQVTRGGFNESDARWSPDGRWIAYVSDESGHPDIVIERWPQDGKKRRVTTAGGIRPRWRRDGRALFFIRGDELMQTAIAVTGDISFSPATTVARWPAVRDYDVAHRSDRLLAILPAPRTTAPRAGLIVDWPKPAQ